jgi:hypothetical protein
MPKSFATEEVLIFGAYCFSVGYLLGRSTKMTYINPPHTSIASNLLESITIGISLGSFAALIVSVIGN